MPDQYRRCQKCQVEKSLSDFHRSRERYLGRAYVCKACKSAEAKTPEFRKHNREKQAKRYERAREIMRAMKDRPCVDCGGRFPHYVMEFDHPQRTNKLFSIAERAGAGVTPSVLAEIEKCDLICSNCHKIRTRRQWEAQEFRTGRPRFPETGTASAS
jgi:hypothetical protein